MTAKHIVIDTDTLVSSFMTDAELMADIGALDDAPSDTNPYVRKDGAWAVQVSSVPETTTYAAASVTLTTGTLNGGTVTNMQTFNDASAYDVQEVTGVPGFEIGVGFTGVASFNTVQLNLAYTNASQHVVHVDLFNTGTSAWDTVGTFQGLAGWTQFQLGVIDSAPYISAGAVSLRLYHITTGAGAHSVQIDYAALQMATQGPQGPRGEIGATGPAGTTDYNSLTNKPTLGSAAAQDTTAFLALHAKADTAGAADTAVSLATGSDRSKLDGIASGAEVNVQADWNSGAGDSQILNKPTLGTIASHATTEYQAAGTYATGTGTASGTNTGDNAANSQYSGLAASKQDTLVSATNIKTVNSASLLGSGDLVISSAAADPSYSPGSFTVLTETSKRLGVHLKLTTTQRAAVQGTGRLQVSN